MWNLFEPWQLQQLMRLASTDADRVETALNTVWKSYPGLFEELAVAAVDQEQLSMDRCAELLSTSVAEVEARLIAFRQAERLAEQAPSYGVVSVDGGLARLSEAQVAVWEIVREYRKLGSVERLQGAFPSLRRHELAAALKYAETHPAEIESLIERYEGILQKRRAEYPFSR